MTILKDLTLKGLSTKNAEQFAIDTDIVRGTLLDLQICKKYGKTVAQLSGRKTSLVRRGCFLKSLNTNPTTKKSKTSTKLKNKPDAFANSNGTKKEQAREVMVEAIRVSGLYGKVLTLPYKYCNIELKLIEVSKKFSFVGCETEPKVYFEMLRTVAKEQINMECSPNAIGEKIEVAHKDEYSHLLLDYCGQLNSFQNDIKMAMENDIVKVGGTISITLNKRKTVKGGIEDDMNDLNPLGNTLGKEVENAILTFIRIVGGFKYSIETVMPYRDKGKGAMILVVVKRLK
jgi:hypothetical protein